MDSTPNPIQNDPHDVLVARADEELTHTHEQIGAPMKRSRACTNSFPGWSAMPRASLRATGRRYAA